MSGITLTSATRSSIMALQSINDRIEITQNRLATGKKVNSPRDNPAVYFTASSMSTRAGQLSTVLDNISTAVSQITASDDALTAMTSLINASKATLQSALATDAQINATATGDLDINGETNLTSISGIADKDKFTVQVGGAASVELEIKNNDSTTDLLTDLNNIANISATLTSDGYLQIEATNGEDLILKDKGGDNVLETLGLTDGDAAKTYTITPASSTRASTATNYDEFRTQLNELISDAYLSGKNLLSGDNLSVGLNEDGTSTLDVTGASYTAAALGISAAAGSFDTDADINAAIAELDTSLTTIENFSTTISSKLSIAGVRETFTTSLINTLEAGADGLTLADTNEETANLLALQTQSQLASASLTLLTQGDESVLQLFA